MCQCVYVGGFVINPAVYTGKPKSAQQIKDHDCNYDNPYLLHQPKYDDKDKKKGFVCK